MPGSAIRGPDLVLYDQPGEDLASGNCPAAPDLFVERELDQAQAEPSVD